MDKCGGHPVDGGNADPQIKGDNRSIRAVGDQDFVAFPRPLDCRLDACFGLGPRSSAVGIVSVGRGDEPNHGLADFRSIIVPCRLISAHVNVFALPPRIAIQIHRASGPWMPAGIDARGTILQAEIPGNDIDEQRIGLDIADAGQLVA